MSSIVIVNIIKFSKAINEEIWEGLIIKFKHKFFDFHIFLI